MHRSRCREQLQGRPLEGGAYLETGRERTILLRWWIPFDRLRTGHQGVGGGSRC